MVSIRNLSMITSFWAYAARRLKTYAFVYTIIADSENETKPPIPKMRQNRRFCEREQIAIKIFTDKNVLA